MIFDIMLECMNINEEDFKVEFVVLFYDKGLFFFG